MLRRRLLVLLNARRVEAEQGFLKRALVVIYNSSVSKLRPHVPSPYLLSNVLYTSTAAPRELNQVHSRCTPFANGTIFLGDVSLKDAPYRCTTKMMLQDAIHNFFK